jgi:hypothetical protein
MDLIERIGDEYPEVIIMDGYDDCIVGICERFGQEPIVAYDKTKVLSKLKESGLNEEEALEFFEFNQIGSWLGKTTPCFITTLERIHECII